MLTKLEHECLSEVMTSYHELNQKKSMPKDIFVNSLFKAHSSDVKFQTMLKEIITRRDEPHSGNLRHSNQKPQAKKQNFFGMKVPQTTKNKKRRSKRSTAMTSYGNSS